MNITPRFVVLGFGGGGGGERRQNGRVRLSDCPSSDIVTIHKKVFIHVTSLKPLFLPEHCGLEAGLVGSERFTVSTT